MVHEIPFQCRLCHRLCYRLIFFCAAREDTPAMLLNYSIRSQHSDSRALCELQGSSVTNVIRIYSLHICCWIIVNVMLDGRGMFIKWIRWHSDEFMRRMREREREDCKLRPHNFIDRKIGKWVPLWFEECVFVCGVRGRPKQPEIISSLKCRFLGFL